MDKMVWIKKTKLLQNFTEEEQKKWLEYIHIISSSRGETMYEMGDICATLDVLLSGALVAYSLSENGSQMAMKEFRPGCIIGANILYATEAKYPLNIYCSSDSQILRIDKCAVAQMLHNYDFTMSYISSASANSMQLSQKVAVFAQKSLRQNLEEYFLQQVDSQKSMEIELPISKKELADYLGVQRPSLFRELKKMKDEGAIDVNNRIIKCHNIERILLENL